ncbi:hypothetical protein J6590_098334 [Homalodisca vitripennis]|nr:hypothetical protein J6590_098334 [Homalodisca vitripennis]
MMLVWPAVCALRMEESLPYPHHLGLITGHVAVSYSYLRSISKAVISNSNTLTVLIYLEISSSGSLCIFYREKLDWRKQIRSGKFGRLKLDAIDYCSFLRAVFLDIKSEKYVGECETVIGVLGADGVATGPVQTAGNAAVDVEAAGVEGTDVEAADGVVAGVEAGDTDTLAAAGGAARVRGNGVLEGKAWLLYCALPARYRLCYLTLISCRCSEVDKVQLLEVICTWIVQQQDQAYQTGMQLLAVFGYLSNQTGVLRLHLSQTSVEQVAGDSVDEEVHCAGPIDSICRIVTACAPVCYSLPIDRRVTFASVFMDPPKLLPVRHSHVEPVLRESKRIPSSGNVLMNVPPPRHLACETTVHGGLVHVEPVMRGSKRIPSSGNVLMNVPPPRHLACETTVHGGLVHVEPVMRGSKRIPSSGNVIMNDPAPLHLACEATVQDGLANVEGRGCQQIRFSGTMPAAFSDSCL